MEQTTYTLAGVMNFLRTEWQQREQTRIEWDIERAEMQNRIMRLESEKIELRRQRDEAQRHLDILFATKAPKRNGKATSGPGQDAALTQGSPGTAAEPEAGSTPESGPRSDSGTRSGPLTDTGPDAGPDAGLDDGPAESHVVSDSLAATVTESRDYLKQCIADIRYILRQNGSGSAEAEPLVAPQLGLRSENITTLANFGSAALTVVALPDNRVAAGTVDGDLLVWASGATEARKFAENLDTVNCMRYSINSDRLIVGTGSSIQVYTADAVPQLVTSKDVGNAPVLQIAVAPNGNLIAAVQANGVATVWSLRDGAELMKMSEPANSVRVCDFADVAGDLHLVLARNSDTADPASPEGNLLLADPLTGQLLKKIVFASSAGISTILLTQDSIVLGTDGGDLRVLGLARGDTLAEITAAHRSEITSLSLLQGGALLSTSIDGRVSVWSIPSLLWKGRMLSHDSGYGALCSSSGGSVTAVGGGDGIIRVYKE